MLLQKNTLLRYLFPALLLTILTGGVVIAFYANHPRAELLADTWSYLYVVDRISVAGQLVNAWRLPCYPLFISVLYAIMGQGNIEAVSIAQAVLFVLATLEIYILAALIFQRPWLAFILSLMMGINLTLISYVKPLMTEGMGLWLLASLTLSAVLFMKTLRRRWLWLTALWMLILFMTRPEWLYLPPLLFAYVLLQAYKKQRFRRLLPHALAALALMYALVGGYIYTNATQNNFVGTTWITNINLVGKILQYNMQDHGDPSNPEHVMIAHTLDKYVRQGIRDPYYMMAHEPKLFGNNISEPAKYAEYIILHHPKTFALDTAPLFFSSLTAYAQESLVDPTGVLGQPLAVLHNASQIFYATNSLFPLCVLLWLGLLYFKGTRRHPIVQLMGLLILICVYGIMLTTAGGYRDYDYMRIYVLFDPLLIVIIWGFLLWGLSLLWRKVVERVTTRKSKSGHMRGLLFSCLCLMALILSGCEGDLTTPPTNHSLTLVSCHREGRVGLLFMRFENRGVDVSSSSVQLLFKTPYTSQQVSMHVDLPPIPNNQERLVTVDVPVHGPDYWMPNSPVKVTLNLPRTDRQPQSNFTTDCHDPS
ncbi:hypothetical protein [Dictyobacter aurantiacus]|uniref:Glycosyltransferase RgtA/B/C/D-like domain-containing protein n=1 Tax=Dictyobacter aurantiacus TaxID=1936993 RepID=A0A401ZN64_9CHLR|nr:hypothetical protein [Dictyobacter aurantiacus]GCE08328.1 hypothetical protein KDAU_56570 [Dictyobacter aurantiacus]